MPVTGEVTYARGTANDPQSGLWSYADRTREIARPGYYSVPLTRYGITAEMTASQNRLVPGGGVSMSCGGAYTKLLSDEVSISMTNSTR